MSKAEFDLKPREDADQTVAQEPQRQDSGHAPLPAETRNFGPVVAASILSGLWLALSAYALYAGLAVFPTNDPSALLPAASGLATPLVLIWIVALVFQRSDPTLERRLAISQNLHKAISPVEVAERRLTTLNHTLRKELEHIDAVADLAADRIGNLENRFQEQVSTLFSSSADAEARAASISDSLARERGAFEALIEDMETRFSALEGNMRSVEERLAGVAHTTLEKAGSARDHVDQGTDQLTRAADALEARLKEAAATFDGERMGVDGLVADIELRMQSSTDTLHRGLDRLGHDIENLEGKSHELGTHMEAQGKILADLAVLAAKESKTIQDLLGEHVSGVEEAARKALTETRTVAGDIDSRAREMMTHIADTMSDARDALTAASASLEDHADKAEALTRHLHDTTQTLNAETRAALEADTSAVEARLDAGADMVRTHVMDATAAMKREGENTILAVRDTGERTLVQMRDLRLAIEQQLEDLRTSSDSTATAMSESVDTVQASTASLTAAADAARTAVDHTSAHLDDETRALEEVLNVMHRRIGRFEEDLAKQRSLVSETATEAGSVVDEAVRTLAGASAQLRSEAEIANASLTQSQQDLNTARNTLAEDSRDLRDELTAARKSLGDAAQAFAGERLRISKESEDVVVRLSGAADGMGQEVQNFTKASLEAADRLEDASERLTVRTEAAEATMHKAASDTREALTASMDDIADRADSRITRLREEMQATLEALLQEYRTTVELAERESAHLAMRLGREADKIAGDAERFIDKTEEVQRRLNKSGKSDFAHLHGLIMESLQSSAIDIHKALVTDIPDAVWDQYLAGDKSIFARRTIKLADRKTRKIILQRFKTDKEFKEAVSRYLKDFQSLMERAMMGDRGNALSIALISSDMGKLYVLLGQSLKKLN